jgi:hypothetical protein
MDGSRNFGVPMRELLPPPSTIAEEMESGLSEY